jgi:hypothetical protein
MSEGKQSSNGPTGRSRRPQRAVFVEDFLHGDDGDHVLLPFQLNYELREQVIKSRSQL